MCTTTRILNETFLKIIFWRYWLHNCTCTYILNLSYVLFSEQMAQADLSVVAQLRKTILNIGFFHVAVGDIVIAWKNLILYLPHQKKEKKS